MIKRFKLSVYIVIIIVLICFAYFLDKKSAKYGRSRIFSTYELSYGLKFTSIDLDNYISSDNIMGGAYLRPDSFYELKGGDSLFIQDIYKYSFNSNGVIILVQKRNDMDIFLKFDSKQSVTEHAPKIIHKYKSADDKNWINVLNPPWIIYYSQIIVLIALFLSFILFLMFTSYLLSLYTKSKRQNL